ncbi:MAG: DUF421 domain-containing protein, partial [Bacillota bacterium]|nr:DUF421 domain-containing protein [Bacillota bacterium]
IPIITLMSLEVVLSFICMKSSLMRRALDGKPAILIEKGKIIEKELTKMRYNLDDLTEELRSEGYFDVRDVEYAILETTGSLNIIPIASKRPLTPADLELEVDEESITYTVIADGKLLKKSLESSGHDINWLNKKLKENNIENMSEIFYASVTGKDFHFQKRGKQ